MADYAVMHQACSMSHTIAESLDKSDADGTGENLSPNRTKVRGLSQSSRHCFHRPQHALSLFKIVVTCLLSEACCACFGTLGSCSVHPR